MGMGCNGGLLGKDKAPKGRTFGGKDKSAGPSGARTTTFARVGAHTRLMTPRARQAPMAAPASTSLG